MTELRPAEPVFIRLVNPHTKRFVAEYDPVRRVLIAVDRGGTAYFDLARIDQEYMASQAQVTTGD